MAKRRRRSPAPELGLGVVEGDDQHDEDALVVGEDEVSAESPIIVLIPLAAAAFTEALSAPSRVNEQLAAALARPRGFVWVD